MPVLPFNYEDESTPIPFKQNVAEKNIKRYGHLDPDTEAANVELSQNSSATPDQLRDMSDEEKKDFTSGTVTPKTPELNNHMVKSISHTAISSDDTEAMDEVATVGGQVSRYQKQSMENYAVGTLETELSEMSFKSMLNPEDKDLLNSIKELKVKISENEVTPAEGFTEKVVSATSRALPQVIDTSLEGGTLGFTSATVVGTAAALYTAPLSPAAQIPAAGTASALAFGLGFKFGAMQSIFRKETGSMYDELSAIRDDDGNPLDRGLIVGTSLTFGFINASLEGLSLQALTKVAVPKKLLTKFTAATIKEMLTDKTIKKALKEVGKSYVESVATETFTEVLQQLSSIVKDIFAKNAQNVLTGAEFEDTEKRQIKEELVSAGEEAFYASVGLGGAGTISNAGLSAIEIRAKEKSSGQFHDNLEKTHEAIQNTKTAKRSPFIMKEFVEEVFKEEDKVYLTPEGADRLIAEDKLSQLNVDEESTRTNIKRGQDTEVRTSDIMLLQKEEFDNVRKDIKPTLTEYTPNEIDEAIPTGEIKRIIEFQKDNMQGQEAIKKETDRLTKEVIKAEEDVDLAKAAPVLMKGIAERIESEGGSALEVLSKFSIAGRKKPSVSDKVLNALGLSKKTRGAISLSNENHRIMLFEKSNRSTLTHEIGHAALKEYMALEDAGVASDTVTTSMSVLRKWLGVKEGAALSEKDIETATRGFETYIFEGKPPVASLRKPFATMQRYLASVYNTAKELNAPINDSVRRVFDNMLSANLEVEGMMKEGQFLITNDEIKSLKFSPEDSVAAKKLLATVKNVSKERYSSALSKEYFANFEKWEREALNEIEEQNGPVAIAKELQENGHPIIRKDFVARFGKQSIDLISDKEVFTTNDDLLTMDQIAALYGFDNPGHLFDALKGTDKNILIERQVNEKWFNHKSNLVVEEFVSDIPEYRDYLGILSKYISKNSEIKPFSVAGLKLQARDVMATTSVKKARRVDLYMSSIKSSSIKMFNAVKRGDWATAAKEQERIRFNYEMASLSKNVRAETNKSLRMMGKYATSDIIDAKFRDVIRNLNNRFGTHDKAPDKPGKLMSLTTAFDDSFGDGFPASDIILSGDLDFRDLSVDQFRELNSAQRYLKHKGTLIRKDLMSDGKTSKNFVKSGAIEVMQKRKKLKSYDNRSYMGKLSSVERKVFGGLNSLLFQIRKLDGYSNLGPNPVKGILERFVYDRIIAGENILLQGMKETTAKLDPYLKQLTKATRRISKEFGQGVLKKIYIEGVPSPTTLNQKGGYWYPDQIVGLAMNVGNKGEKSNYNRLLAGYEELTPQDIDTLINLLSIEDMDAVQGIWDAMEEIYPASSEVHYRLKNYFPDKVDPTPFMFKGKQYKGGYYPIKYDRDIALRIGEVDKISDYFDGKDTAFDLPYAKSDFLISRAGDVRLPIKLSMDAIDAHFRKAWTYIGLAEVIRDSDSIITDKKFQEAATDVIGKDSFKEMREALKHIANPVREGLDVPANQAVEKMRGLATAWILALNASVALKQPLSVYSAIHRLGELEGSRAKGFKVALNGFGSTMTEPVANYKRMIDTSPYMNDRLKSFDRELRSAFNKMTGQQQVIYFGKDFEVGIDWQEVKNFGFFPIRLADLSVVVPLWNGAFDSKLSEDGSNVNEARDYADSVIRETQPSARPLDLTAWQRKGGVYRLMSMFQTFTIGKYSQRQRAYYGKWKAGDLSNVDYAFFNMMDAFMPLVTIGVVMSLIHTGEVDEKEIAKDTLISWMSMGVPIASNIFRSIKYGDPISSPVFRTANELIENVMKLGKPFGSWTDKEIEQAGWGAAHALSIVMGVPVSKVIKKAKRGAEQDQGIDIIKYLMPAPLSKRKTKASRRHRGSRRGGRKQ